MGFKKILLCAGGVFLAASGPISLFTTSDMVNGIKRHWLSKPAAAQATSSPANASQMPAAIRTEPFHSPVTQSSAPFDPAPITSLSEVLRFDVTTSWVMQRWPRVSTGLPHLQLQGYRVTLITGTALVDLAGSLTYYFNAQQQVQRITFRGTTGDPSALIGLLTGRYNFTRRLTNDPGATIYEAVNSSNQPIGSLKIRSAQVIKANQPYTRFEVELAMDRPG
jgi:hypothetical protein